MAMLHVNWTLKVEIFMAQTSEKNAVCSQTPKGFFPTFPTIHPEPSKGREISEKKTSNCMKVIKKNDDVDVFFQP